MPTLADLRPAITTLSFDCYGTLIDWEGGIRATFEALAARARAQPLEPRTLIDAYLETEAELEDRGYRRYREIQAAALTEVAKRFEITVPLDRVFALSDSLPNWRPFADTNAALIELKSRFRLGIVSNVDNALLGETMRRLAVPFDFVITAEEVRAYKPSHPHFLRLLEEVDKPEQLLHVAQSAYHDGTPTSQLGIAWAWINRNGDVNGTLARPVLEVRDLLELAAALG